MMFKDAFLDDRWTEFILTRFEKSDKPEHKMYVRYVSLRMKQDQTPEAKNAKGGPKTPSEPATVPFDVWTELQDPEPMNMISWPPSRTCGGHGNAAPGEPELGTSHGSGRNDDAGSAGPSPSLLCEDRELSFLTDAEAQILNDLAFCEQQLLNAQVDMDYDFQPEVIHHSFHRTCQRFTKQFQAEFHAVARKLQGKRYQIQTPKLDVLEIIFFRK